MGSYQNVILQVQVDSDDPPPEEWNWREMLNEHGYYSQEDGGTVYTTTDPRMVATGNPVDGFTFYGPFLDAGEARSWAERRVGDQSWWVTTMEFVREAE